MYPINEEYFLPECKRFSKDINERISNRLKEYYRWIKRKKRKDILNDYHSAEIFIIQLTPDSADIPEDDIID